MDSNSKFLRGAAQDLSCRFFTIKLRQDPRHIFAFPVASRLLAVTGQGFLRYVCRNSVAGNRPLYNMPHETDLPCTECGNALEERTVSLSEHSELQMPFNVAVCSGCGVRDDPENILAKLTGTRKSNARTERGNL